MSTANLVHTSKYFKTASSPQKLIIKSNLYEALTEYNIDISESTICINGDEINYIDLPFIVPEENDIIEVFHTLHGGGENGKAGLRLIATLALAAATFTIAGPTGVSFFGSKLAAFGAATSLNIGGMLAINALIPPPEANSTGITASNLNQDYALTGSQNAYGNYNPIPKHFGRNRFYPPKASLEYTEIIGGKQYLNSLFCIGYGLVSLSDFKIGETPIADFGDVKYEIGTSQSPPELYPSSVIQQGLNITLDKFYTGGTPSPPSVATILTTEPNTDLIEIDFYLPGLYRFRNGALSVHQIDIRIGWRRQDTGGTYFNAFYPAYVVDDPSDPTDRRISGMEYVVRSLDPLPLDQLQVGRITGDDGNAIRAGYKFKPNDAVSEGTIYEIQVSATVLRGYEADPSDPTNDLAELIYQDDVTITSLKSYVVSTAQDSPIQISKENVTYVALSVLATEKLNGTIDSFNCVVQAYHPYYNGTIWGLQSTSNPAWCFVDALTKEALDDPISTDRLNIDEIMAWADINDAEGFECNLVVTKQAPLRQILSQICSVGRAVFNIKDGQYTAVVDTEQTVPAQVFTPRNSYNFTGSKVYSKKIHALKVNFRNKETGYILDQAIVYNDGYTETNAIIFDELDFNGVTDYDQAWKLGRYHLAVHELRAETYEIDVDIENIRCTRGDLVYYSNDVILVSLGSGRLKEITIGPLVSGTIYEYTIVTDDYHDVEAATDYSFNIRANNGTVYTLDANQFGSDIPGNNTFTGEAELAVLNELEVGNIYQFGESGRVSQEMLVRFIEPKSDLTATITLVPYSPAVLDADQGEIPPYDSVITVPPDPTTFSPLAPQISQVISDETVLLVQNDGSLQSRIVIDYSPPVQGTSVFMQTLEAQYRPVLADGGEINYADIAPVAASTGKVTIPNVKDGGTYQIRLRYISTYGVAGEWTYITHIVIGKSSVPPDVQDFSGTFDDNLAVLIWSASSVADVRNYQLFYGNDETGTGLTPLGYSDTTSFRTPAIWLGSRFFYISAVDTSGNESGAVYTELTVVAPSITSVDFETIDNNVILRWTTEKGSLPVRSVLVQEGEVYATPVKLIGEKTGTFTSFFENTEGLYTYWLTPIDSAGNEGTPATIQIDVAEPPGLIQYANQNYTFENGTTYTNCIIDSADNNHLIIPSHNPTETHLTHYTNAGYTNKQGFIDGGYELRSEPVLSTAEYREEFDYGSVLSSSTIAVTLSKTTIGATPDLTIYIDYKELSGDSWTEGEANVTAVLANNFRYVRVRYLVDNGGDDQSYFIFTNHNIRLQLREKNDNGTGVFTGGGYSLLAVDGQVGAATAAYNSSFDLTPSVTLSGWFKLGPNYTATVGTSILLFGRSSAWSFWVDLTNNILVFTNAGSNPTSTGAASFDITNYTNDWIHLVGVLGNNEKTKLYVNGRYVSQSAANVTIATPAQSLNLLKTDGGVTQDSACNNCEIWTGRMSDADIYSLYKDQSFSPTSATLFASYDMTDGTGSTVTDGTGSNDMTISVFGYPLWDVDKGSIFYYNKSFLQVYSVRPDILAGQGNYIAQPDILTSPNPEHSHVVVLDAATGNRASGTVNYTWTATGV